MDINRNMTYPDQEILDAATQEYKIDNQYHDRVFVGGPEVRFSVDELRESAVLHQIDLGRGLALFEQQVIAIEIGRAHV